MPTKPCECPRRLKHVLCVINAVVHKLDPPGEKYEIRAEKKGELFSVSAGERLENTDLKGQCAR